MCTNYIPVNIKKLAYIIRCSTQYFSIFGSVQVINFPDIDNM